ncbi:aminotransferase class III-fold pyridoxal phosphate-dependent enzyme, partial [Vibrio parahaemolyticus]
AMPGGNTRTSLFHDPFPLCMVRGQGARLTDADGHEYIDFLGEFTAGIFGHSPAPLKQAIVAALDDGINLSGHNRLEAELAALI